MASRTAYSTWTPQKLTLFDGHYLRNRSTLDIGVLGYIDIVQHKEHSPEVSHIPRVYVTQDTSFCVPRNTHQGKTTSVLVATKQTHLKRIKSVIY